MSISSKSSSNDLEVPSASNGPEPCSRPLTVTFATAKSVSGLGLTTLWALVKEKRLHVVRVGRRTLIVYPSLERLLTPAADAGASNTRRGRRRKVLADDGVGS